MDRRMMDWSRSESWSGFAASLFFCVVDGERGNDYYVFCVSLTQKMNMMFALVGSMKSRCFEVIKIRNCAGRSFIANDVRLIHSLRRDNTRTRSLSLNQPLQHC